MKSTSFITSLFALGLIGAAVGAAAAPATDLLFSTPHFETADEGAVLVYDHETRLGSGADTGDGAPRAERIELTLGPANGAGARRIELVFDAGGSSPRSGGFEGVPGNPLLMVFLESVVETIGGATGGSPFYLRNRIKEALREGIDRSEDAGAEVLTIRPFAGDDHSAALGPFAGLEVDFVVDRAAPGMLTRMTARAGSGATAYFEEIRLAGGG